MTVLPLLVMLSATVQPGQDTALALTQARELVAANHATTGMYEPGAECEATDLEYCMRGDWSCIDAVCLVGDRRALLQRLDGLAPLAGNSEWLFRQRVALAVKSGNPARAAAIAASCSGEDGWCLMLRGFTAHRLSPGEGTAHFDSAFALLGDEARCVWTDPRPAAPVDLLDIATEWDCPEDEAEYRRFWWLADPLWSRPGNERYLEHLSRRIMSRMAQDVYEVKGRDFDPSGGARMWEAVAGDDPWAIPLRQGFPNSVMHLVRELRGEVRGLAVRGSVPYVRGGYGFAPDSLLFLHPLGSTAEDWAPEWRDAGCASMWTDEAREVGAGDSRHWLGREESLERCGQERYTPRETWHGLPDHQVAIFRRDAHLLVAAAAHVPPEIGPVGALEAALVVARLQDRSLRAAEPTVDALRVFRARVTVPDADDRLASLEVVGPDDVARARFGMPVPRLDGEFGLSDVALVNPGSEPDGSSPEQSLLPFLEVTRDQPVGVYLEVYGLLPDEQVDVTLTVGERDVGVVERIGRFLRLTSGQDAVEVEWQEGASEVEGPTPLFVTVDLQNLPPGEQRLVVEVRRSDGRAAEAERDFVIE